MKNLTFLLLLISPFVFATTYKVNGYPFTQTVTTSGDAAKLALCQRVKTEVCATLGAGKPDCALYSYSSVCTITYSSNYEPLFSGAYVTVPDPTPTPVPTVTPTPECPAGKTKVEGITVGGKPICVSECEKKNGQIASTGVFGGKAADGSDVPTTACINGCTAFFSGLSVTGRRLVNGQYIYQTTGSYKYASGMGDGTCTVGPLTPAAPEAQEKMPDNSCGPGQSSGIVNGVAGCFGSDGKPIDPNNPPPECPANTQLIELNGVKNCYSKDTGNVVPAVTAPAVATPAPTPSITQMDDKKVTNPDGTTTQIKTTTNPDGSTKTETTNCSADGKTCSTTVKEEACKPTPEKECKTSSSGKASGTASQPAKYDKDGNAVEDGFCSMAGIKDSFICKGLKLTKTAENPRYDFDKAAADYTQSENAFKSTLVQKMNEFKGLFNVDMPTGGNLQFSAPTNKFGTIEMDLAEGNLLKYIVYFFQFLFGMAVLWILIL